MKEGKIIQWRLAESSSAPGKHKIAGLYLTDKDDFMTIKTSLIQSYDEYKQTVKTVNSVYKLGSPADPSELDKLIELYAV